jgi:hypothetical protein
VSSTTASNPSSGCEKPASLRTTAVVFATTSFLSALLLFQVQLIISKYILPWYGGTAAVWTTSLLVFQVLLLGGYIYSHWVSERLSPPAQSKLHLALLGTALLLVVATSWIWPSAITPGPSWKPLGSAHPAWGVTKILLVATGIPFLVLSTTAPLLQRWFAAQGAEAKTYRLYAVSNFGSLLGLLSFPFLLEPTLRMTTQGRLWASLFAAFVAGCAWCAWRARLHPVETASADAAQAPVTAPSSRFTPVLWFLLPACASALLLAATNMLCQRITSVPLLWVLPLALYLLSFILCFESPRWYQRWFYHPAFAILVLLTAGALIVDNASAQAIVVPLVLFAACMVCHGELVRLKPGVKRLTAFYLAISAGGAGGGMFVAVIAPVAFNSFVEYQLTLAAIALLLPLSLALDRDSWIFEPGPALPAMITGGALVAAWLAGRFLARFAGLLNHLNFFLFILIGGAVVTLLAFLQSKSSRAGARPGFRFVQLYVAGLVLLSFAGLYKSTAMLTGLEQSSRNFYGAVRIFRYNNSRLMMHGPILHGSQLDPPLQREPTTFYGRTSGIGLLLESPKWREFTGPRMRVGVVGLGAGTLATYGEPGDTIRYYEINPDVVKYSSGPQPAFTFLRDSKAHVDVETGDARLLMESELARGEHQNFDVLVLDAFSGDAIPVHLLTKEAFQIYWQHLNPDHGILALHVSSRHIYLQPVVQGLVEHFHASAVYRIDYAPEPCAESRWVLISRNPEALGLDGLQPLPPPNPKLPPRLWTDDYSDIIRLLH